MLKSEIYEPSDDSFFLSDILKKEIPKFLDKNKNLKFLEIGCGSGIQLQTALATGIKKENIFGADINDNAVKYCKKLGFACLESDLFSDVSERYDLIVFNPPYLPEDKKEPKSSAISTTGGRKGGEIINKFLLQAKKHLAKGGRIILLISSLSRDLNFEGYKKKILGEKKLFFEKISVFELSL